MFHEGPEGLLYAGPRVNIRESDPTNKKPQRAANVFVKQFDLSKDATEFQTTLNKVHNDQLKGRAVVSKLEYQYDAAVKSWLVLFIWLEYYLTAPEDLVNASVD